MHSALWLQFHQPFRPDALSYMVWFSPTNPAAWFWLPFALLLASLAACLILAYRKGTISFPLAASFCLLLFFCTNKQAFANYYYLVMAGVCIAITAMYVRQPEKNKLTP